MQKLLLSFVSLFIFFGSKAQTFTGTGGAIPDNGAAPTCFPLTVTGVGTINGTYGLASVCINITHTWDSDLEIKLKAPDGTLIPLSIQSGGSGQDYNGTCFTATATIPISTGTAPFSGSFLADGFIGNVNNGQNANGDWNLCIQDLVTSFTGSLVSWNLTFNNTPAQPLATPVNDDPCHAIALTVGNTCNFANYTNIGATGTTGVATPTCASYSGSDVWFKVTVPAGGSLIFDTEPGSMGDGGMAIYKGSNCGALAVLACDDNSSLSGSMPKITMTGLVPGNTIWIRVWSYNNSDNGSFGICVTSPPVVTNDEPCNAIPLSPGAHCSYSVFSNAGATATPGVPAPNCAIYLGADVWFQVIVPTVGEITVDTYDEAFTDGGMALYKGTSCSSLTLISCDDNSSTNALMPKITATGLTPGSTVWIRMWKTGAASGGGTFGICVTNPVPPPVCVGNTPAGNTCALATPVCNFNGYCGSTSASYTADSWPELTAAFDDCLNGASIENNSFISFVASATNASFNVWVTSSEDGSGIQMMFYDGGCGAGAVNCHGGFNSILNGPTLVTATGLIPGNTYYLMIDGFGGDVCDYVLDPISGVNVLDVNPSPASICLGGSVNLTASGGNGVYSWSPSTGLSANSGATVTASPTTNTTYIVVSTGVGDCPVTISTSVRVDIVSAPIAPSTSPVAYCQGASSTPLTAGGLNLLWYTNATGGTGSTEAPTPYTGTVGSVTYYVSQSLGTCEGPRAPIVVTVSNRPALPTIITPVKYCQGAVAVPLSAIGTNLRWYTAANGGIGLTTPPTPSTANAGIFKYYVTQTPASCESARIPISVITSPKNGSTSTVTVCPAQLPYGWNGKSYNTAGTYKDTLVNIAGCDSVITLILSTGARSVTTTNLGLCATQYPYSWNGQVITIPGTYKDTLVGSSGCDSVSILVVATRANTFSTTRLSICQSEFPYSWNGNTYNTTGTYTVILPNAGGCDSSAKLILSLKRVTTSSTSIGICPGQLPYVWSGNIYNAAGTYIDTLVNAAGCDSIVTLVLTVGSASVSTTTKNLCASQLPLLWNGIYYNTAGSYTATLINAAGCDSVATLNLSVKATSSSNVTIPVCASQLPYSWNGNTYAAAGTYRDTLVNAIGCDSVVTFVLQLKATSSSTTPLTICPAQLPYSWNGNIYTAAGTYKDTLVNAAGCDSFVTLVLSVAANIVTTARVSLCPSGFPYPWHGRSLAVAGTYRDTLPTATACDSITVLIITLKANTSSTFNKAVCPVELPYSWNGNSYNTPGTYTITLANAAGCDSVATLILTLKATSTSTTPVTICPAQFPYRWNGNSYTAAGTYNTTLVNAAGCDSLAKLVLTVRLNTTSITYKSICPAQLPYHWNGNSYNASGSYNVTLNNALGCDSIATLLLTVKANSSSVTTITICPSLLPYSWNGNSYTASGNYNSTLTNAAGCDSVATLVLKVKANTSSTTNQIVCDNELPFVWNGNIYTTDGTYTATLVNAAGCDSVATLVMAVKPAPVFSLGNDTILCPTTTLTLLPGVYSQYLWQDFSTKPTFTVSKEGSYGVTVKSSDGCSGSSKIAVVYFENCDDVSFPNAITPNGDGNNDKFGAMGNLFLVSNYTLSIYNRYGQVIFKSNNPYQKWDGLVKNIATGNLNYVWVATYTLNGKLKKMQKGSVLIIR